MNSALKDQFGPEVPREIARMITQVHPRFAAAAFIRDALRGHEPLSLTERARHVADALHAHLPAHYPEAIAILQGSVRVPHRHRARHGMTPFLFMPHTCFVAQYGLDHFEASMQAQHELTQLFSAEFSIRAFLVRYPRETLVRLQAWARDASPHVRRLVSEGTRPRLPWAPRLPDFQRDPAPVLALLELLKDDPELYVRRSVANNLNDIGKDHPALLAEVATRWLRDAPPARRWIVRHALRSALKRAEPGALRVLGFHRQAAIRIGAVAITPRRVPPGTPVTIAFTLRNTGAKQSLLVDLRVHYVKASGRSAPRTFKLRTLSLARAADAAFSKTLETRPMSTRRHYPGVHRVEALVNGQPHALGSFRLLD